MNLILKYLPFVEVSLEWEPAEKGYESPYVA